MALTVGELLVAMKIDTGSLGQSMDAAKNKVQGLAGEASSAESKMQHLGKSLSSVGAGLSKYVSLPLAAAGAGILKLGMDAVESENLVKESFKGMTGQANAWAKNLSQALGLNEYAVKRQAATFDVMYQSMGLSEKKSYEMATGLTKLAYDMASFYNLKPEEAFEKLRAGISGEIEPLKQLGILLTEDNIKTKAMEMGLGTLVKTSKGHKVVLSEQDKALARYALIMDRTSKAQGDMARTADSPSNALKRTKEMVTQAATEIGMSLMPMIQQLTKSLVGAAKHISNFAKWFGQLPDPIKKAAVGLVLFVTAAGPLLMVAGSIIGNLERVIKVFKAFHAVLNIAKLIPFFTSPIGLILVAITALAVAVYLVIKNWDKIKAFFQALWAEVTKRFKEAWEFIKNLFLNYTPQGLVIKHWDKITAFFRALWEGVKTVFRVAWEWLKNMFLNYTPEGLVIKHWSKIRAFFSGLWNSVRNATVAAWNAIKQVLTSAATAIGNVIISKCRAMLNTWLGWLKSMWSAIKSTVGNWLAAGREMLQALWDGAKSKVSGIISWITDIGRRIVNAIKRALGISSPSKEMFNVGVNLMEGLKKGVGGMRGGIESLMKSMGSSLAETFSASMLAGTRRIPGGGWLAAGAANSIAPILQRFGIRVSGGNAGRSRADQQRLYNQYGAGRAARPGHSYHEAGAAVDLPRNLSAAARAALEAAGWAQNVPGEPWHWTYMPIARAMTAPSAIRQLRTAATTAGRAIGAGMEAGTRDQLAMHSPSRVYIQIGQTAVNSMTRGMQSRSTSVYDTARQLANILSTTPREYNQILRGVGAQFIDHLERGIRDGTIRAEQAMAQLLVRAYGVITRQKPKQVKAGQEIVNNIAAGARMVNLRINDAYFGMGQENITSMLQGLRSGTGNLLDVANSIVEGYIGYLDAQDRQMDTLGRDWVNKLAEGIRNGSISLWDAYRMMLERAGTIRKERQAQENLENKLNFTKKGIEESGAEVANAKAAMNAKQKIIEESIDKMRVTLRKKWKELGKGLSEDLVLGFMEGTNSAADLVLQSYEAIFAQRETLERLTSIFGNNLAREIMNASLGTQAEREAFLVRVKPIVDAAAALQFKKDMISAVVDATIAAQEKAAEAIRNNKELMKAILQAHLDAQQQAQENMLNTLANRGRGSTFSQIIDAINANVNAFFSEQQAYQEAVEKLGQEFVDWLSKGMLSGTLTAEMAADAVNKQIIKRLSYGKKEFMEMGRENAQAYASGMESVMSWISSGAPTGATDILGLVGQLFPKIGGSSWFGPLQSVVGGIGSGNMAGSLLGGIGMAVGGPIGGLVGGLLGGLFGKGGKKKQPSEAEQKAKQELQQQGYDITCAVVKGMVAAYPELKTATLDVWNTVTSTAKSKWNIKDLLKGVFGGGGGSSSSSVSSMVKTSALSELFLMTRKAVYEAAGISVKDEDTMIKKQREIGEKIIASLTAGMQAKFPGLKDVAAKVREMVEGTLKLGWKDSTDLFGRLSDTGSADKIVDALIASVPGLARKKDYLKGVVTNLLKTQANLWKGVAVDPAAMPVVGQAIIEGIIDGMKTAEPRLENVMAALSEAITAVMKEKLSISSPSRVFFKFGGHIIEGLVQGLLASRFKVAAAMGKVAGDLSNPSMLKRSAAISAGGPIGGLIQKIAGSKDTTVVIELDGKEIARKTLRVQGEMLRMKGVSI